VQAPDAESGVALLRIRTGHLSWHADTKVHGTSGPTNGAAPPAWVLQLPHCTPPPAHQANTVTLRPAAVLVLLTDGPAGPQVLLTVRAPDLNHYAGQLVFPGGAAEPDDRGVVNTALREATEETGLDPDSVHIIGTLPAFALPDSGFHVTPVIAWSPAPRFLHPANRAEVTAVHTMTLSADRAPSPSGADGANIGAMTSAVLDILRAHLSTDGSGMRWSPGTFGPGHELSVQPA
jgi:8-oxo-dGTP pyrophosphatase MutT (NUDIX family)